MRVGHVHFHLAEGDVDGDSNIHVGELRLGGKKHSAPLWQVPDGGKMEAVGLGRGIEAALCVHIELTIALTPIHGCAIEGIFALRTLLPVAVFPVTLRAAET